MVTQQVEEELEREEGRIIYVLVLVVLVQTIYPMTVNSPPGYLMGYQLLYASLAIAGVYAARDTVWHFRVTAVSAAFFLLFGFLFALEPTTPWRLITTFWSLLLFQGSLLFVLLRYIFLSRVVTRDVLYAATAVYFLLGAFFVSVYGLIEVALPGSFADGAFPDAAVQWQQLVYYSYATLTTLGYGDVLPVSMWARSAASLEAIVGVLYMAVLMARLVSLYSSEKE